MAFRIDKLLILSGFFGPIVFTLVIFLSGFMLTGYDHANQVISDLGAIGSPAKDFMNYAGFMLFGISIMAFSIGVYKLRKSWLGKIIAILFALGGIAMFLIGVFPSDVPCPAGPCPPPTFTAEVHNLATYSPFVFLFPAFILLVVDTRNEKSMRYYFAIAGVLGIVIAYCAYTWLTASSSTLIGAKQRASLAAFFLLLIYTSAKLYRLRK